MMGAFRNSQASSLIHLVSPNLDGISEDKVIVTAGKDLSYQEKNSILGVSYGFVPAK